MSNWQPIETAPRDGSDVLARVYKGTRDDWIVSVKWVGDLGGWVTRAGRFPVVPTHWKSPSPTQPEPQEGVDGE